MVSKVKRVGASVRVTLRASAVAACLALVTAAACSSTTRRGGGGDRPGSAGDDSSSAAGGDDFSSAGGKPSAGTGSIIAGGKAGTAGTAGGSPPLSGTGSLGSRCGALTDCAAGLICLTPKSTQLDGGAPPRGLCTMPCVSDQECAPQGSGALCYPSDPSDELGGGYCIEGCSFGQPSLGEVKCHNRDELACNPARFSLSGDTCFDTTDCQAGELCQAGGCSVVFPGCLPSCRGDIDCAQGMYCDQSFLSGVCRAQKPTGKGLGEPCTVPGPNEPAEPDECLGFCQPDSDVGDQGHCSATCGLLSECGWNAQTGKFDGACFYASVLTADVGYIGDFGFCTPTCNCTAECQDPALGCALIAGGPLPEDFRGPGLCFTPDPEEDELDQCGAGGDSGAGGAGAGGAANAGAGGAL